MTRATRGDGIHLVDSQKTERIQATDPPPVWPAPSIIDRLVDAYWERKWPARALLILGVTLMGAAIIFSMYGWHV